MGPESNGTADENEAVAEAREDWKSSTTALERVQQVVEQTTTPKTAKEVADEALVSEPTARKHLKSLVEIGKAAATEEQMRRGTLETKIPSSTNGFENSPRSIAVKS